MNVWNKAPFFRLLIPFIFGILFAIFYSFSLHLIIESTVLSILILFFFNNRFKSYLSFKWLWGIGVFVNALLFVIGFQITYLSVDKNFPDYFGNYNKDGQLAYVKITEPLIKKSKSYKTIVQVLAVKTEKGWVNTRGKALMYFSVDSKTERLQYGDHILTECNYRNIPPPQNSQSFNYQKYLSYNNIFKQAYLKKTSWHFTTQNSSNRLIRYSYNFRNKLLHIFSQYNISGNQYAVAAALLLGYDKEIDKELISAYSNVGVIHILSVSGLHIGLLYLVFGWMFSFFEKYKNGNFIKSLLLIAVLWFYAALTGFSPSVLRATTMFSFIVIAQGINRYTNIYNTLAASAFLLLLFNPYYIMNIGFQLSYLAVIGIVLWYPLLYNLLTFQSFIPDKIWSLIAVSLAAQIATFPLCLFYFHQFPNYFLLANIFAIPLSTLIMLLGILLFVFCKIPLLAAIIAKGVHYSVEILNDIIMNIQQFPFAVFKNISITAVDTLLIYLMIIYTYWYFIKLKALYLNASLICIVVLLGLKIVEHY